MLEILEQRCLLNATLDGAGNLVVNGSANNDTITLTLLAANIVVNIQPEGFNQSFAAASVNNIGVICGAGNDVVTLGATVVKPATLQGDAGNDSLTGGGGAENLQGGDGDDRLDGGLGADPMSGDNGIDTVVYPRVNPVNVRFGPTDGEAGENDSIDGSVDIVIGGAGNDRISAVGQTGTKSLYGQAGNDTLEGSSANDRLNGGQGNDDLRGFDGDDILLGGPNSDKFNGGAGLDTASYYYTALNNIITADGTTNDGSRAEGEKDNVKADVENIEGGSGNDNITGSALANRIEGGNGGDTITGGAGADTLLGEDGNDSFFAADGVIDTIDGGPGTDTSDDDPTDLVTNVP